MKAAVIIMSDPKSESEVTILFQGAGTRWAGELANRDHPAYELFTAVRDKVAGVSCGCADVFGAAEGAAACGLQLISDNPVPNTSGLPSLARLSSEGFAILTF